MAKLILVDGYSLMFRAFHALPLLNNSAGVYTNAVHGFLSMLFKVMGEEQCEYCAVAFDLHAPTFRHLDYPEYKAGRAPTPEELKPQVDLIQDLLEKMHIPRLGLEGYEADDILGTASARAAAMGVDCLIITGDRDAFQLAGDKVSILYTKRGISDTILVTPAYIQERYGVTPLQMIDVKGLMGDNSDNIPGVPGVGEKTALKLIQQYGSLEEVLNRADSEQKGKLRERLMQNKDQALYSKWLATIVRDAPLDFDLEACRLHDLQDAMPMLHDLELKTLAGRLSQLTGCESAVKREDQADEPDWKEILEFSDAGALHQWAKSQSPEAMALYIGSDLSLAFSDGQRALVRLGGDLLSPGLQETEALEALQPLLDQKSLKLVHNIKELCRMGARMEGEAFDVMLAGYVLQPQRKSFSLEALCQDEGMNLRAECPAETLYRLSLIQQAQLKGDGLETLYKEIELPLAMVLLDMEREGFMVDDSELKRLGETFSARIRELTDEITQMAGVPININSPKQLGELLFERMGLPARKKTSSGYSTSAEVLEQIADLHPIIPLILEYRRYAKLNSTYIEALLKLQNPDGRIHTRFDQVSTATGRISSLEPNLQNIPIRTELGKEIRRAFSARPGWRLVDADYSQIELRVLAHMSHDQTMQEAFRMGQDIHQRTASEVYGVPLDEVTHAMRSAAKAVNFGIVYGISDFGLARNIGVSRKEAGAFIELYLNRYPGVRAFMENAVKLGQSQGYVTTLMGRRRYLPELKSSNYNTRSFGERAAMNSPIQGTAADIIKMAMVQVHDALKKNGLKARLILQVHDELIVECPPDEVPAVKALLVSLMEGVMRLDVPLKVDVSDGVNWYDCK